ncbi:hypothetical protein [Phaeobacter sp. 11ANDIMAR09]|uniref:hypothetical protein n=1 Tax=Phaeobacter sp. 11ANDIMAR09 TaxID=1225647 RepID=UPI0006C85308|nr:hypothetical protein AN476_06650 [Phaeobacter sp. 11ANDIMAR09]
MAQTSTGGHHESSPHPETLFTTRAILHAYDSQASRIAHALGAIVVVDTTWAAMGMLSPGWLPTAPNRSNKSACWV